MTVMIVSTATTTNAHASSASGTGQMTQSVISQIGIRKVSDLDFGVAATGDPFKIVAPGNSEGGENASFEVSGEPDYQFTIILPADGTVQLTTSSQRGGKKEIPVYAFKSNPQLVGQLDNSGKKLIYVGATRGTLAKNQAPGQYQGQFTVTVSY